MASGEKPYVRTLEDIEKIVHYAKLSDNTLHPVTQAIYFSDMNKNYKLMELDKELLSLLTNGSKLTFRGLKNDKAVLCTDSKTYEVKEAETSNSVLLISGLKFPEELKAQDSSEKVIDHKDVIGVFHTYLEVKTCKPKLQKLRKILQESVYQGSELESGLVESGIKLYSFNDLLGIIQASELELRNELSNLYAFELNGYWRMLEFNYHFRVLTYFVNLLNEQSWKPDQIPVSEILDLLNDIVPTYVLEHLISVYTEEISTSSSEKRVVKLIESRICRILGEALLRPCRQFGYDDFLKVWQESVPEGLNTNLEQLSGLVYTHSESNQKTIYYCPEYELPEDVAERIQYLFSLKDKWSFPEIKPYIEIFASEKVNENTLLMKHARASTSNGVRLYSSRHGK